MHGYFFALADIDKTCYNILKKESLRKIKLIPLIPIILILLVLIASYKKVGPNEVLIVTGGCLSGPYVQKDPETHTKVKVIKGGGAFVIPILQRAQVQTLDTFNIDVNVENIMTRDMVPVDASANAVLRVGGDPKMIATAAEKTLGLDENERDRQMVEVVKGGLREVLSGLTPTEANDRASFQKAVIESISDTFANLGLEITSLQITSISDKNGYYKSLSAKEIADKQAEAKQAEAEADKRAKLIIAKNQQEAMEAQAEADRAIALATKTTSVAKAQYDAEVRKETAISLKAGDISDAEQDAILKEKQIAVKQQELKATVIAKQEADAEAVKIKAAADAAAVKTKAQADADQIKLLANANADKIRQEGQAEAEAQKALSDALAANGQYALQKAIVDSLPEISKNFANAIASIDSLTVFDGASGVSGQTEAGLAQSLAFIKQATGLDLADFMQKRADGQVTIKGELPTKQK